MNDNNTYITLNEVKNETLAKLTWREIGTLGLYNVGVSTYRGELKTRCRGFKRHTNDNVTYWFEDEKHRLEFTRIQSDDDTTHWAERTYNKETEKYEQYALGINGVDFIRSK